MAGMRITNPPTDPPYGEYDRGAWHLGQRIQSKQTLGQTRLLDEALQLAQKSPGSKVVTWEQKAEETTFSVHAASVQFTDKLDIQSHVENVARNVIAFVADNDEVALNYVSGISPQETAREKRSLAKLPSNQQVFDLKKIVGFIQHGYGHSMGSYLTGALTALPAISPQDRNELLKTLATHLARFDTLIEGKSTIEDALEMAQNLPEPYRSGVIRAGAVQLYHKGAIERVRYWVTQIESAADKAAVRQLFIEDALRFNQPERALQYLESMPLPEDPQGKRLNDLNRIQVATEFLRQGHTGQARSLSERIEDLQLRNQFVTLPDEAHHVAFEADVRLT